MKDRIKKKIMILGAGVYQVPLIKKAREMGLQTIVVSRSGDYPGIPLADVFLDIDTTDYVQIVAAAKKYAIDGIVTTGTDVSVPSVGAVVDELGLKGPSQKQANIVSSKTAFRIFQKAANLNCPEFEVCSNSLDAWNFYDRLNEKVVFKPDDASGSRGVTILDRGWPRQKIEEVYRYAESFSRNGLVCTESFIEGVEVGGDAFVAEGDIRFFVTTCKHMEGVLVRGHSLPGTLSAAESGTVKDEVRRILATLDYTDGPVNFDVIVGAKGVTVLEMGLRNGGNGIVDLIYHASGVDLIAWLLALVVEDTLPEKCGHLTSPVSSYVFGADHGGKLANVSTLTEIQAEVPDVFDMLLAVKPGGNVAPFVHNANLIGYVLAHCGASAYQQMSSRLREILQVEVEE